MFDMESLRNETLIEERQNYENDFISIVDIMKSEELDYYTGPKYEEYFEETTKSEAAFYKDESFDFDYLFECEDNLIQQRDEILIRQRLEYEKSYFKHVEDDIFDFQIESMEEEKSSQENDSYYDYEIEDYEDYTYDQYEEDMFYHLLYLKKSQFEAPGCNCPYSDYMPNDDGLCDYLDCYDYP